MAKAKYVYFFGGGKAEGDGSMKELGRKGRSRRDDKIGLPVPGGHDQYRVCALYYKRQKVSRGPPER